MTEVINKTPERKYCDYSCEHAEPREDRGACSTFILIYCKKHERQVNKSGICLSSKN